MSEWCAKRVNILDPQMLMSLTLTKYLNGCPALKVSTCLQPFRVRCLLGNRSAVDNYWNVCSTTAWLVTLREPHYHQQKSIMLSTTSAVDFWVSEVENETTVSFFCATFPCPNFLCLQTIHLSHLGAEAHCLVLSLVLLQLALRTSFSANRLVFGFVR